MRARQSAERRRQAFGAAAGSRPEGHQHLDPRAARLRQAVQGKDPSTGCTRPSRSRAWTDARCSSRAARCWADRVRSTACFTCAASTRITIAGASAAMPAGAMTTCCPISRRRRTSSAAPTIITAAAARCRCRTGGMPIRCRKPSSRPRSRPAFPTIPISTARPRKAPAFSRPRRGAAAAREHGVLLSSSGEGAAAICTSRPRRWRSASCSRDAARVGGRIPAGRRAARPRGRARKSWCPSGAYNSPQLLQLSGVGPAELLKPARHRRRARCARRRQRSAGSHAGPDRHALHASASRSTTSSIIRCAGSWPARDMPRSARGR